MSGKNNSLEIHPHAVLDERLLCGNQENVVVVSASVSNRKEATAALIEKMQLGY